MTETRLLRAYAEVDLGRQRSPQHEVGPDMVPYLRAANVKDGELRLDDVKTMNFTPSEQLRFALRPGDVLVTEGSGSLSAVGASAVWSGEIEGTVCFQNTLLRIRPRPSTDPRYLAWWCRHAFADGLFASVATGANIFHVSAERVRSLPMTYLPLASQRRIADYLDTETARIDALITKKRRMVDLVEEWWSGQLDAHLFVSGERSRLSKLVPETRRIMYGIVLPGPNLEIGRPIVKGGNVRDDTIVGPLSNTSTEIESSYMRSRLRAGDLAIVIRGAGAGRVGLVPVWAEASNITQDVARVSPRRGVNSAWLRYVLQAPRTQEALAASVGGAAITGINIWDLCRIPVPLVRAEEQDRLAAGLSSAEQRKLRLVRRLTRQIGLLREHRHALITAAVTGEFPVPNVAA